MKARVGDRIRVDLMPQDAGAEVTFSEVLMLGGDEVKVGKPVLDGVSVTGKVIEHGKGKKVIAFKYQQRNHSRVKKGFRRHYTEVEITAIQGA